MIEPEVLRRGAAAAALVTQMAVLTVVGGWGGRQLDGWLLTGPLLQIAGFVTGFTIGLATFLRYVTRPDPTTSGPDDQPPADPPV